jgi:hypothetical protein
MRRIFLSAVFILCGFGRAAWAQQTPVDTIYLTGRADRMPTVAGGETGLYWHRSIHDKSGFHVGGLGGSVADSWWLSGQFAGHRRWRGVTTSGTVDFGRAGDLSHRFNYGGYKAAVAIPALPNILLEADAQRVVLPQHGSQRVYRTAVSWTVRRSSTLQGGYYRLLTPGNSAGLVSGRLDVTIRNIGWIAGALIGPPGQSDPLELQLHLTPPSREVFGGCKFGVGRYEMSTVVDVTQSAVLVTRILMSMRIPLR